MNRVERAIIMAAGLGNRMRPVTLKTPKPLIKVNGNRMIDTIIAALRKQGINEIYVVVGYLKEQFYSWAERQQGIQIIENPYFDSCNNISSLYVAKEKLDNVIILDGDQIIYNDTILCPDFERSGYNAVKIDYATDEWVMQVNEDGIVTSCSRTGGNDGWQLYSISRWSKEDGKKLQSFLEEEFITKNNRQIYWDDVAMFCHSESFELGVFPMKSEDICEIDSFDELVVIDPSYKIK
ncbi:MAG: NTP transferase domain-containing protein [Treponemataceae bacterium]|nr:NTP transferase domain-containing protein [Treponemataceae bacterium]